ncbi:MAG TPA: hypothetical protein VFN11_20495 [Ktedonobacterales bacterium]|nr:hypothetical protein [Ktedonobacterales bacterium]
MLWLTLYISPLTVAPNLSRRHDAEGPMSSFRSQPLHRKRLLVIERLSSPPLRYVLLSNLMNATLQ